MARPDTSRLTVIEAVMLQRTANAMEASRYYLFINYYLSINLTCSESAKPQGTETGRR